MSSGRRRRALAAVVAVAVGNGFVWVTIEILRSYPELRLLVIWLLLLAGSIATVATFVYMCLRAGKDEDVRTQEADTLVSAVAHGRRIYPIE